MIRIRPLLQGKSITRNKTYYYNTASSFTNLSRDDKTNLTTLTLNRPPVNSLNLDFLKELCATFDTLEEIKPKGIIIKSFSDKVFSSGLDINELRKPEEKRLKMFWEAVFELMIKFYGFPYPTVAVVNGHSPAGGCLLALCCDYRIMVDKFSIGLNEVALGIKAPRALMLFMKNVINSRQAELALTTGKLFTTKKAFEIGLIDEIASNTTDGMDKARRFFEHYNIINLDAFANTKRSVRKNDVEFIKNTQEEEVRNNLIFVQQEVVQRNIESYFNKIKSKSAKRS